MYLRVYDANGAIKFSSVVAHANTTGQTVDDHHAETHTIVSHDTTATGAEVTALVDNSTGDGKHWHSKLVASDGSPDPAVSVDAAGQFGVGTEIPDEKADISGIGGTYLKVQDTNSTAGIKLYADTGTDQGKWQIHVDPGATRKFHIYDLTAGADRLVVDSSGNVEVIGGNLIIGTAGKGIDMNGGPKVLFGTGTPEGAVTAAIGSMFMRADGGAGTSLYVKESGTGNTGWVGK